MIVIVTLATFAFAMFAFVLTAFAFAAFAAELTAFHVSSQFFGMLTNKRGLVTKSGGLKMFGGLEEVLQRRVSVLHPLSVPRFAFLTTLAVRTE